MNASDYEFVREQTDLNAFAKEHLHPIGRTFECPACHSGTGPNGTPAFSIMPDGMRWRCFSCECKGDIFDLYGIIHGTEDRREQLGGVARWAGIELESGRRAPTERKGRDRSPEGMAQQHKADTGQRRKRVPLYRQEAEAAAISEARDKSREYVERCRENVGHPNSLAYLESRGYTLEVARSHGLGYDPEKQREIIPYPSEEWYYTARDVTDRAPNKYMAPDAKRLGKGPIWDIAALEERVAFIVEGQHDAIAVAECGGRAVCTNGAKDISRIAAEAAKHPRCYLYLMFDADDAGRRERDAMLLKLEDAGAYSPGALKVFECPYPDPSDWFKADKEGMRAEIVRLIQNAPSDDCRIRRFVESLTPARGDVAEWLQGAEPLQTRIPELDEALGGGLYSGLHVLAAPPGAGKSSLAAQISANVAIGGAGVLYISLEMPRSDMVARFAAYCSKAYDREGCEPFTFAEFERTGEKLAHEAGGNVSRAREMAEGDAKAAWMLKILEKMGSVLYRLAIEDGRDKNLNDVSDIVSLMERAARSGCSLVVVDYLQYIDAGKDADRDDKAERDGYVARLLADAAKRLDLKVLALSSVTKSEGSKEAKDASAFAAKGSSDIGHDAVTVMRLEQESGPKQAGNTVLRLKIAKNRKGESGKVVSLVFWPGYATVTGFGEVSEGDY